MSSSVDGIVNSKGVYCESMALDGDSGSTCLSEEHEDRIQDEGTDLFSGSAVDENLVLIKMEPVDYDSDSQPSHNSVNAEEEYSESMPRGDRIQDEGTDLFSGSSSVVDDNVVLIKMEPVDYDSDSQPSHNSDPSSEQQIISGVNEEDSSSRGWCFPSTSGCGKIPLGLKVEPGLDEEDCTGGFFCFYCQRALKTLAALRKHIKQKHSSLYRSIIMVRPRGGKKMRVGSEVPFPPMCTKLESLPSTTVVLNPLLNTSKVSSEISSSQRRLEDINVRKVCTSEKLWQIMGEDYLDEDLGSDWDEDLEKPHYEIPGTSEDSEGEEENVPGDSAPQASHSAPSSPSTLVHASTRKWTRQPPSRPQIPFTLNPGLNRDTSTLIAPRDFFDLFLTEELLTLIVTQTNFYADYLLSKATLPKALIRNWKPLDVEEFKMFLGLLFHMGTIPLSKLTDYWNTDPILFGISCFRRVMSRDRFLGILQALHFAQNPEPNEYILADRLYKIRPLIDFFHRTMDQLITPTKRLIIDEAMILWKGPLIFRQNIKNKAPPYGIKLYTLNETSGLVLRFATYTGVYDQEVGGQGHASSVVHKLMERKLDVGHSLFMDSLYNSVTLVHELLKRNTYMTGTLRKNRRGNPPEVINANPKKGEVFDMYSDEGVCVLTWKDKREVLMISSEFSGQMVNVTTRQGVVKQKPEMVAKYNESMGGIDHFDQMMAYYPFQRKTFNLTKKMGIHILHVCLYNAFILYNKYHPKMGLYDFRNSVIKSLLPPSPVSPSTLSQPLGRGNRGLSPHFPTILGNIEGKNRKMRKRCRVCLKNRRRKYTSIYCPACPDQPNLCLEVCFQAYHADMIF